MDESTAQKATGTVSYDPTSNTSTSPSPLFIQTPIKFETSSGTHSVKNWEFFEGILITICFKGQETVQVAGSGVMIAPGIALCAAHVIQDHMKDLNEGLVTAFCKGITSYGAILWNIKTVTMIPNTDLAILGLQLVSAPPEDKKIFQTIISTRTPKIGEMVHICGFRPSEKSFPTTNGEVFVSGNIYVCSGKITNRYPLFRDRGMIKWPTIEIEAVTGPAMSGGPVFDSHGLLVGLLTSSHTDSAPSYASLLWPALGQRFQSPWPNGIYTSPRSLLELDRKLCGIEKPEAVTCKYEANLTLTEYHEWE